MSYEASGLKKKARYEFWVTASTNMGEGQPSKSVSISPSTRGISVILVVFFLKLIFLCYCFLKYD